MSTTKKYRPRTYRCRLEKLTKHLERGKLGHKTFDFAVWNNTYEPRCGTAGCAVGECPIVFPRYWKWAHDGDPVLRGRNAYESPTYGARRFFGLTDEEMGHLFIPYEQNPFLFGGEDLFKDATRKQVARNMREFLKIKKWS